MRPLAVWNPCGLFFFLHQILELHLPHNRVKMSFFGYIINEAKKLIITATRCSRYPFSQLSRINLVLSVMITLKLFRIYAKLAEIKKWLIFALKKPQCLKWAFASTYQLALLTFWPFLALNISRAHFLSEKSRGLVSSVFLVSTSKPFQIKVSHGEPLH